MKENNSPWIYQLNRTRPEIALSENIETDVLLVGGGIAGVSTLYYTLKNTDRNVCLLEAKRIAHGATGHNAGYVVAAFEKPYKSIIEEYGEETALEGIGAIHNAWEQLEELVAVAGNDVPYEKLPSWGAYPRIEEFIEHLQNVPNSQGIRKLLSPALIASESGWMSQMPTDLAPLCKEVPQQEILDLIESEDISYMAALPGEAAVTNSALLTDRVLTYCMENFKDRVRVFENSPVHGVELDRESGTAFCDEYSVKFKEVVLATNGFENFFLKNLAGGEIDSKFHHNVYGVVGYMSGFLTDESISSAARYYFASTNLSKNETSIEPYFYMSRRNFKTDKDKKLISIGGPEVTLEEREVYFRQYDVDDSLYDLIDSFMKTQKVPKAYEKKFNWHGLMGYTTSGLRLIGREPNNPILLYNIGCNGIGILTSIYGGKRIADHLSGKQLSPSIFDPKTK